MRLNIKLFQFESRKNKKYHVKEKIALSRKSKQKAWIDKVWDHSPSIILKTTNELPNLQNTKYKIPYFIKT